MPYTTKIGLFAYFFNVNSSDPLPQGNHDNIHTSTHMDTQPTVASQPILRTTNAQVSNAINMAGGNAVVQPKKHRMTKDERLVHDAIRGFYKRIAQVGSFLGTACVFHTLCFTIQYGSLFFSTNLLNMCILCRSNQLQLRWIRGPFPRSRSNMGVLWKTSYAPSYTKLPQ